jgi:outer membrane protein assembly factor BamA
MMKSKKIGIWVLFVFCLSLGLAPALLHPSENQDSPEGKIIKEIRFEGLKRTKEYIITRELISQVGEPMSQDNIDREFNRLVTLDIFSNILIEPELTEDGVILTYRFTENFPVMVLPAFRITDENGISVGGNIKTTNLLGRNIFLSGGMVFGGTKEVELRLRELWAFGNHFGYLLEYYHRERDNLVTDSFERSNEFTLMVQGYLSERWRVGGGFESLNIRSDRPGTTLDPDGHDRTARFNLFLNYDNRDKFPNTRSGWWNAIKLSYDSKLFNSYSNFFQVDFDIERYQPLPFGERHGLAIFSFTTLRSGTVGETVAPWQVFGIGGTNTVRGWEFAARKGKNQFINTLEYRYTLLKMRPVKLPLGINWRVGLGVALFGDLGIGWDTASQFRAKNFIGGVGAGIRIIMPVIGMLRFDVGIGQPGASISLHIGSMEKPEMTRKRVR